MNTLSNQYFNTINLEILSPLSQFEIRDLLSIDAPAKQSGKLVKLWEKLPNSGDALKLLIPSFNWKIVSGWINYSCTVRSQVIIEKWMGYRGSKSIVKSLLTIYKFIYIFICSLTMVYYFFFSKLRVYILNFNNTIVKEQRVYGSWQGNFSCLRYTLMGFERNYQIIIPSNLQLKITKRQYYTKLTQSESLTKDIISNNCNSNKIDPSFITGFVDAEGSFMLNILKSSAYRQGWKVQPMFLITQHVRDLDLIKKIKVYLDDVGSIDTKDDNAIQLRIFTFKEINEVIIPHFDKYPLITQKRADFELFKLAIEIINQKGHLTSEGLQKLVAIKSSMNKGISESLKKAFPDVTPYPRPLVENLLINNPYWIAGFTTGEGCFYIKQRKSTTNNKIVEVIFSIVQHSRDEAVIRNFFNYFEIGRISTSRNAIYFSCSKFSDIINKLIPFFEEYKILGVKSKDFSDWVKICEIVRVKQHLTDDGFNQILNIKSGMNTLRIKR